MDKELLAVIGKLYIENMTLYNTIQSLQDKLNQATNGTQSTGHDKDQQ